MLPAPFGRMASVLRRIEGIMASQSLKQFRRKLPCYRYSYQRIPKGLVEAVDALCCPPACERRKHIDSYPGTVPTVMPA